MALGTGSTPLDLLNLRLSLIDRDFNEQDYEVLLGLDQGLTLSGPRNTVTDAQLAGLSVHLHPGCGHSKPTTGRRQVDRAELLRTWGASKDAPNEELLCSVCLDDVQEGEKQQMKGVSSDPASQYALHLWCWKGSKRFAGVDNTENAGAIE
eukprot:scaffold120744_cov47-Prasinocladus_malaysianus.AAC.1